jgi:tetratricopeptide (TPR) repeat protein
LKPHCKYSRWWFLLPLVACLGITGDGIFFVTPAVADGLETAVIRIEALRLPVEVSVAGTGIWRPARTNDVLRVRDHLRTGEHGRASLRWSDQSIVSLNASTELEVLPPHQGGAESGLQLFRGVASFFHRDKPGRIQIITRGTIAGVEGTEFVLAVDHTDRTTMSVVDGKVRFGNELATLLLTNGEQAVAAPGQAPTRAPGFIANNLLQWCFYYPAVLDVDELKPLLGQSDLAASLQAYQRGDLPAALEQFPRRAPPLADGEKIYHAALLLSVGDVEAAERALAGVTDKSGPPQLFSGALRRLIAAVKREEFSAAAAPRLASEWLADSYYQQSLATDKNSLANALQAARQAVAIAPQNGFAWERIAELEFGFGRLAAAEAALDRSLALAPHNAQALALKGFILAAQNQTRDAVEWFERAISINPSLGNAWLGRGLCRLRMGRTQDGQGDLLMAAATEPQRAELRSYLARAYAVSGDAAHATSEIAIAEKLDPNDPTPWFYSALFLQQKNRINEAIRDLALSKALNDNRRVYRSAFLLDQDRSVRNINLAGMYQDAGLIVVGQQEAARAVNEDYANYAAHLFLADSYFPQEFIYGNNSTLRYETLGASEHFIADLLAPPNVSLSSPRLAQQAYSQIFLHDGSRVSSSTEYLSRGAWSEAATVYGSYGNFGYSMNLLEQYDPGQRRNGDSAVHAYSLLLKQQFSPRDTVFGIIEHYESRGGDLAQSYDPQSVADTFRFTTEQQPNLFLGYHHEWSPGSHTLALLSRQNDSTSFYNYAQPSLIGSYPDVSPGVPALSAIAPMTFTENFLGQSTVYSGELQQIWEQADHTTILGTRWQAGDFKSTVALRNPFPYAAFFPTTPGPVAGQIVDPKLERVGIYGYHQWQIFTPLKLIAGLAYDHVHFPENFINAPVSDLEKSAEQLSPKAGIIWTPSKNSAVRLAYTRSLGGVAFDQSQTIEPSQVAGFVQHFRSLMPESVAGSASGAAIETFNLAYDHKFASETYVTLGGEVLNSQARRVVGVYNYYPDELDFPVAGRLRENLDFQEKSILFNVNQLLGRRWSVGAGYRITQAILDDTYPDLPSVIPNPNQSILPHHRTEAIIHQVELSALCNLPSGFFTRGNAVLYSQFNYGYPAEQPSVYPFGPQPAEPGDTFVQLNFFVGYRSPNRKLEVSVGLLNLTDQDYHLNPLTSYADLPRERTLALRLKLDF